MPLNFARLQPDAYPPTRKHAYDAGMDVYSIEDATIWPFSYRNIHTGITLEIPAGYMLLAKPKGRNNHLLGAGVIDAGYQGEIVIKVVNYSWKPLRIVKGMAVAQLIQIPVICEPVLEINKEEIHKDMSERGSSGGIHST
jgi:dUTP pyrophosphatase